MAGSSLCVSCASLPVKERGSAVKTMQCADCKMQYGITSYGVPFRIQPTRRRALLSPMMFTGMMIGAGLFIFVMALVGLGLWSSEKIAPSRPTVETPLPNVLAGIPEVAVDDPMPAKVNPHNAKQRISQLIDRIRGLNDNGKNKDAFVLANMDTRKELRGLPFVMGDACRLEQNKAQSFQNSVQAVRDGMESDFRQGRSHDQEDAPFWTTYYAETAGQGIDTDHGIAALTQILGPERDSLRIGLVRSLKPSKLPEATRALARAAIFDASFDVRSAAIKALKDRPAAESADILMQGIRYPLAIVAKRSAQAMIELKRDDLTPQLVAFLADPAPGDPTEQEGDNNEKVTVVREVVKINHHRNCLLCHPPSLTGSVAEVPGVIPIPGSPFPTSPKDAYGSAKSQGDPMVRADTTYLRQDFSVMMPVENAAPWPSKQRFDFLVRTRVVEGKELATLQKKVQARPADFLSENHKAAVRVLENLTGHKDVAPTQVAWQRVLGNNNDE